MRQIVTEVEKNRIRDIKDIDVQFSFFHYTNFDSWIRWLIAKRLTDLPEEKADISFYRF